MKHTYQKLLQISLLSLILTGCQSLSSETGGKTELPSEKPVESTSITTDKKTEEVTDSPFESDTSSATEEEKTEVKTEDVTLPPVTEEVTESLPPDTERETIPWDIPSYYAGKVDFTLRNADLKTSLFHAISSHTNIGYNGLWNAYLSTDLRDDGTIWDMYSNCSFTPGNDKCGNYSREGDCYNREHTIPQSVFNEAAPMKADLFHVYPTDGKINGNRSNYPHAEVSSPASMNDNPSSNGSMLGESKTPGVTGKVFEPVDEYKGDFARTYFYFVTCYQDKMTSMNNYACFSKNTYPSLSSWAITLYKQWSIDDPVSQKEIDRNEAVYQIQHNRNPFIDFPGIESYIW